MMNTAALVFSLLLEASMAATPIVIGHRGAPGHLPDHTLEGYRKAVELGADYIEPDLVITKDGELIARHDAELGATTDVASKFPERRSTRTIDGEVMEGWFSDDFTLAEIKTLRARQPMAGRSTSHDGQYLVPTFAEILTLAKSLSTPASPVGVYPEIKHPKYFAGRGRAMEGKMVDALRAVGLSGPGQPVFLQCFEATSLRVLASRVKLPLIQLIGSPEQLPADGQPEGMTYGGMLTEQGLAAVATWADGIGIAKGALKVGGKDLVDAAHNAGLQVHVYTFRDEQRFRIAGSTPEEELLWAYGLGVDGVFSDYPGRAVKARAAFRAGQAGE
jgi:glycerophosphoryl diester phosphodiesterase